MLLGEWQEVGLSVRVEQVLESYRRVGVASNGESRWRKFWSEWMESIGWSWLQLG